MNIHFNYLQAVAFNLKDKLLASLTPLNKKILIVATIALGCLAAIYFACRYVFKAEDKKNKDVAPAAKKEDEAPVAKKEDEAPVAKKEDEAPAAKKEDEAPAAKKEDEAPAAKKEDEAPATKKEDEAPVAKKEDEAPVAKKEDEAPATKKEDEAPVAKKEDEAPVAKKEDEAPLAKKEDEAPVAKKEDKVANEPVDLKAQEEAAAQKAKARADAAADRKANKIMNIVIVGRSRGGKSTMLKVMNNPFYIGGSCSLFRATVVPVSSETKVQGHTFKILDTPGLCEEVNREKMKKRSNLEIAELIAAEAADVFGGEGYDNVDAFIFAATWGGGVDSKDTDSLGYLLPTLPADTKKMLVLTRSENILAHEFNEICDQMSHHPSMSRYIAEDFGGKGKILFTGAFAKDDLYCDESKEDRKALIDERFPSRLNTILKMRAHNICALVHPEFDALLPFYATGKEIDKHKSELTTEEKVQYEKLEKERADFIEGLNGRYHDQLPDFLEYAEAKAQAVADASGDDQDQVFADFPEFDTYMEEKKAKAESEAVVE